jgi:hypothetical protein
MWDIENEFKNEAPQESGIHDFFKGTPGLMDIGNNLTKIMQEIHSDHHSEDMSPSRMSLEASMMMQNLRKSLGNKVQKQLDQLDSKSQILKFHQAVLEKRNKQKLDGHQITEENV